MHFPLEAASKHVSAQVLLPALINLIRWFLEGDSGTGKASSWYLGVCCPGFTHGRHRQSVTVLSISLSLGKGSESKCLKLALKMKNDMLFLLWDLEEGWARVQPKKGTCFFSLSKTVPADSGQRKDTPQNVINAAWFRTHPVNKVCLALHLALMLTGAAWAQFLVIAER